jgi:alpha-galactosidase
MIFRKPCFFAVVLLMLTHLASANRVSPVWIRIPYGKNNLIRYNLRKGTMDVSVNGKLILVNSMAVAKINGVLFSSTAYSKRTSARTFIKDQFGTGEKWTITLTGAGKPLMKQIFFSYPDRNYFLTEVRVLGAGLSTNYMEPINGRLTPLKGDARTLFVPFDNDTFISYDAKPFVSGVINISAEVGAVYDNLSRKGLITGSVTHNIWKSGVKTSAENKNQNKLQVWGGYTEEKVNRDKIPHGSIAGDTLTSPKIFFGIFSDWRKGLEQFGLANRLSDPAYVFKWTQGKPVGWNSWGVLQDRLTYDKALKVADFFADSLAKFRVNNTAFVDLDSFWDSFVNNGDYAKLKMFADYCKSRGLKPGIYWAPFTDWGNKNDPQRKVQGSNYTYGELWTKAGCGYHDLDGGRALDPTHPGTKERIAYYLRKFKECGFEMIKIDFLGHGAIESDHFFDPKVTTGMQAFRQGMEYIDDQLDGKMFIYAAISPNIATGRYVHSRRIACDAFKTITNTKYTLNSVNYGWWLGNIYDFIDADHVVFADQPIGANRARLLSSVITGTFFTGDDFSTHGQWSARAMDLFQNKELLSLVKNGKCFVPVEGNTGDGTSEMFTSQIGGDFYLAVFNYSKTPKSYTIDPTRIGLPFSVFNVKELLQNKAVSSDLKKPLELDGADAVLIRFQQTHP